MLSQYHITCFSTNIHQNNYLFLSVWNQSIIWNKENSLCEAYFWNPLEYDVKSIKLHTILNIPIFTFISIAPTKGIVESWQFLREKKSFNEIVFFSPWMHLLDTILVVGWFNPTCVSIIVYSLIFTIKWITTNDHSI